MNIRSVLLLPFFLLLNPLFLFAQAEPTVASGENPVVNMDFRMMAWTGSIWELYLDPEKSGNRFSIGSHTPSDWMKYSGPAVLFPVFKNGEDRVDENGIKIPRPVAYLQPKESGKWLFLLFKDKNEAGELIYRCLPVRDESRDLDHGYLVINLSESELGVSMNGELHKIEPLGRVHFAPKPFKDNTVDVKIAAKVDSRWELKKSNTFSMPEKGLTTLFVTTRGRHIWIRRFVDKVLPSQ